MKYILLITVLIIIIVTLLSIIKKSYLFESFTNNISILNLVLYSNDS